MLSQKPKIIGIFLMFLSITMLSPLLVDYIYAEKNAYPYILSFSVTFSCGFFCGLSLEIRKRNFLIEMVF